jgi:hypothetical protein
VSGVFKIGSAHEQVLATAAELGCDLVNGDARVARARPRRARQRGGAGRPPEPGPTAHGARPRPLNGTLRAREPRCTKRCSGTLAAALAGTLGAREPGRRRFLVAPRPAA